MNYMKPFFVGAMMLAAVPAFADENTAAGPTGGAPATPAPQDHIVVVPTGPGSAMASGRYTYGPVSGSATADTNGNASGYVGYTGHF